MSRVSMAGACISFCMVLLMASAAHAVSAANKCEASELKTSGKYSACRLKAESKAVKTGGLPEFSKCDSTFSTKFGQANTQGMGQCPSSASQAQIQTFITQCTDDVAAALGGAPLPVCQPPPLQTGQTTAYGTGSDGDLQKGATRSYTDNADGTITDNTTGLMWEKKDQSGSIHDWTNTYTWCADVSPTDGICDNGTNAMDGTMVTTFLANLNGGGGFAGHTDWRVPNLNELQSLANYGVGYPAVSPAFNTSCVPNCTVTMCSCVSNPPGCWSSTSYSSNPIYAWGVDQFVEGGLDIDTKTDHYCVRAVRNAP